MPSSIFFFSVEANAGFAIPSIEKLFYSVGIEIAIENKDHVYFAYPSLDNGLSPTLAENINVLIFDPENFDAANLSLIKEIIQNDNIQIAIAFDYQPIHPLFHHLRQAGINTIISYWGAPISSPMPIWKRLLKKIHFRFSNSKMDGLIFESREMAKLAEIGRGMPKSIISVVPLGIDTNKFYPRKTQNYIYENFGIDHQKNIVVFSGHVTNRKGIKTLIKAAIEILDVRGRSDVAFLICGDRPGEKKPFENMYYDMPCAAYIHFAGYRKDLDEIFPNCYCGVIPSDGWDSFTYSSLEMAASGIPVIASRFQGLKDAIIDGITGLHFRPKDANDLANKIERLLDDLEFTNKLGKAGIYRVTNELSFDVQKNNFIKVLNKYYPGKL